MPIFDHIIKANSKARQAWGASTRLSTRTEVCPPTLFAESQPLWQRWVSTAWQWLWEADALENHPQVLRGLHQVKSEFVQALWDLQSFQAAHVREQIEQAKCLRDLWHLRPELFQLIATHRGEVRAHERMGTLNRHFPVRVSTTSQRTH